MNRTQVIAIFDIGKTNKKLFLFDKKYNKVFEESIQLKETVDEDGDPCEDLKLLTVWIKNTFDKITEMSQFQIEAINFSAYGASFVHILKNDPHLLPLYNYLKPFQPYIEELFFNTYGPKIKIEKETGSPFSGNLNSGLQIYSIKKRHPDVFKEIKNSLHLPQYLSYLITGKLYSDITSIGCHTFLWNFEKNTYHDWVIQEGIDQKLAPVEKSDSILKINYKNKNIMVGRGLHDSSASLIPYLTNFNEPFVLISTGTWCVSLNPFNNTKLTEEDLKNDSLCYIQYQGLPVKANRLFAGYKHEQEVKNLSSFYNKPLDYYKNVQHDSKIVKKLIDKPTSNKTPDAQATYQNFSSYEEAYHQLVLDIIALQVKSTTSVLEGSQVKQIFIDGGFSKNTIYMNLMAQHFPEMEIYAASMAQATAIGAALAIHKHWNEMPIPNDIIELKIYSSLNS